MRIGICTTDFKKMPMDALFERIASLGFECMQFAFPSIAQCDYVETGALEIPAEIAPDLARRVAARARAFNLGIAAINGTFNMCHPDSEVRMEGLKRLEKLIDTAALMEVGLVTICTGSRSRDSLWKRHEDNDTPEAWEDARDCIARAARHAAKAGVTLLIETEAANVARTARLARALIDQVEYDSLGIVLDPANLFLPGRAYPENVRMTLDDALDACEGYIRLAHGKDIAAGQGIEFCAAGRGIVDFEYMLRLLRDRGYEGDFILHGIYDESDMPRALAFAKAAVAAARLE